MKTMTSKAFEEHLARSGYGMERPSAEKETLEPTPEQSKETERVIWLFIMVLFSLILLFGYLFWHKV